MSEYKSGTDKTIGNVGVSARRTFGFSAALLTMLAGAPAGFAQQSDGESSDLFGSLTSMFAGNGGQPEQPAEAQAAPDASTPAPQEDWRTDGLYYDENMTVELHVQDEDLVNVLQMLSIQSERNIVASNDVSASVTANLYGVTFHEALDAILHVNGYGYIERGNFIYVYPLEEIIAIEQASRVVESKVINLSFLSAVDAADFCSPLLSADGEIKTNGKAAAWADPTTPTGGEDFANASTLVIYDFPENIEAIERLIAEIDTRPAQILVEATIVQTSLNEANAFGVDFSIIANLDLDEFASPLSPFDGLFNGGSSSSPIPDDDGGTAFVGTPGGTSGPGTFKAGVVSNDVAVFVRALQEVTDTTIISNPKVVTLNRQPGRVLVGRKVGYLSTTSTETSTTQTVEFLDTGTQLNFRPFVTSEGLIRMELKPQVSEAQLRTSTDATGAAVTIPDEVTNELIANVLVPDGHTVVLGGLFRESTSATRRQVPVLGDIPLIGTAFRGHDDEINRQEIIFLITPSVVSDQVLVDAGIRGEEMAQRVRAGAREGMLVFSRERQSSQLLVEAEHLAAAGETDRALHTIRRCLFLSPNQPGAIELRERLLNERDIWPSKSLLETIIQSDARDMIEHNIHDRGFFQNGLWVSSDAGEDSDTAVASDAPTRERVTRRSNGETASRPARTSRRSPANRTAEPGTTQSSNAASSTFQPESWMSPEFVEMVTASGLSDVDPSSWDHPFVYALADAFAQAKAQESGEAPMGELDAWWNTPSFIAFASAFDQARARENGEAVEGAAADWWSHPNFIAFNDAFEQARAQETGESPEGPLNAWWEHPYFFAMTSAFEQARAQETGEAPAGPLNTWWEHPHFMAFTDAFEQARAQENGEVAFGPLNAWWEHPHFIAFSNAFDQARAQEIGEVAFGPLNAWWEHPYFVAFTDAFDQAIEQESGETAFGPIDAWWDSPEFIAFVEAYEEAKIAEQGAESTSGYTEVETNNDD